MPGPGRGVQLPVRGGVGGRGLRGERQRVRGDAQAVQPGHLPGEAHSTTVQARNIDYNTRKARAGK